MCELKQSNVVLHEVVIGVVVWMQDHLLNVNNEFLVLPFQILFGFVNLKMAFRQPLWPSHEILLRSLKYLKFLTFFKLKYKTSLIKKCFKLTAPWRKCSALL